jgi:hypothetical protein
MKIHFFKIVIMIIIVIFQFSCQNSSKEIIEAVDPQPQIHQNQIEFFQSLSKYCGNSFSGKIVNGSPTDTAFNGKTLIMHVKSCTPDEIKIPFFVGEDKSRTWVITQKNGGLQLKHDHRHEDGSPDEVTMYGGFTSNGGSANRQLFPADQETAEIIPLAIGNIWWIDVVPDSIFTYNLRRVNTDRLFSVEFDLKKPLTENPSPPWGWKD